MDIRKNSDLQLLRISQGAHELTHLIDSWSKTSTPRIESVEMANELLRSSLELQQSLQILSRLQEASRKMLKKSIKNGLKEEDEEENSFMATCLQKPRLSADDFSTNSVEELKQVIRDRLCKKNLLRSKSDNEKAFSDQSLKFTGRKIDFSSQTKKMKAPSLIAKLMGLEQISTGSKDHQKIKQMEEMKEQSEQQSLEEIIQTMRFKGTLKNDHYERYKAEPDVHGINFGEDDEVLPIVIQKSLHLPPWERGKTTLAELLLEQKTFDHDYSMPVKENLRCNTEPIQNLSMGVGQSQKEKEKEFDMETNRIVDRKISVIEGKGFTEIRELEAIEAPVNKTSVESTMFEERILTTMLSVKTNKGIKQKNKDNRYKNSMALKTNCRVKKSREKPVRKFITENETNDQRFKDGKLRSSGTETAAISGNNSMLTTDGLLIQKQKETTIFVNKEDETKKDHKIVFEVMPKTNHALRNSGLMEQSTKIFKNDSTTNPAAKSEHLLKHQHLNSKFFEINACIPAHSQAKNSEDLEGDDEQRLLDCAKELMPLKSHERKLSTSQMRRPHQQKRSSFLSFNNLFEGIGNQIEELVSYSEIGNGIITKSNPYIIVEKYVSATWDVGKNNRLGVEEADTIAVEVEKQIISRLIMEVAMDLVDLE